MSRSLRIDVFFDFICPWCLIGKRQLERALAQLRASDPQVEVELAWHGVQLLPQIPAQGEPFAAFYLNRLGSAEAVRMRQAQVQQAAAAAGLEISLASIASMPNTADAHRLLQRATAVSDPAQRDVLLERLFAAYFHNGEDLGDRATLLAIAQSCGLDAAAVADCLRGDGSPFVGAVNAAAGGVPHFIFDRRKAVSGAQPAEVLLAAMHEALAHSAVQGQSA
ncbi:DsbA family oxidoreductase [Pseudomonas sp. 8AS]|uniref:DsbA family oxidoreductase n=1 Tax=Pseudomonas sp. 8AS TaxID=2653163 RepID=UPI0012F475EA|nr:DsbA family oxidoreductase [Pseudomonas sp. 8AS]VXC11695.1 DsbA family oxidoreductase [Pseudomonas sp. 8AS]